MEYTFIEYADMHLMYGLASCNALEARRLYHERYPNHTLPNQKTFHRVDQRLMENGGQFILIRMQFANWLLDQQRNNVNFISNILFTGEASFTKNGITNLHNVHVWADENPHATVVSYYQHQFQSINIWAGIIGNFLIGPFVLPERLNGQLYLEFLQNDFPDLIEDLPLETCRNMYVMHDGAPAH
ncbi:hypothetical protein NQ318_011730 [Aromia moschata]|uniref:DUF4817 domain-containing protein n=1 Tax=Aromia moschata TaxID=1265417 RepID=A0AAV8XVT7_9CUCU|nr:hypothetical protein NQ318_011730 [Aromia moschata]